MTCYRVNGGIICTSPVHTITDATGKKWTFEEDSYFGPSVLTKIGDVAKRQPCVRSPFWAARHKWFKRNFKMRKR